MLALLTHQFPELMGVFAKAVSICPGAEEAMGREGASENWELLYKNGRASVITVQYCSQWNQRVEGRMRNGGGLLMHVLPHFIHTQGFQAFLQMLEIQKD